MTAPSDHAIRERIATDLHTNLVVEAAAGTGKTTALVRRVVALLESGTATLDRVVAVTFTESAAGELKLRLRTEIENRFQGLPPDSRPHQNLLSALPQLEEARIGTIHSLCSDLLREHPVEAQLDPRFEVAAEGRQQRLFVQAFDRWFQRELASPSAGVRRFLRRKQGYGTSARRQLLKAAQALSEWRDFATPWRQDPFDREGWLDRLLEQTTALAALLPQAERWDKLYWSLHDIDRFVHDIGRKEQGRSRDYDGLEADFAAFRRQGHWKQTGRPTARHQFKRTDVLAQRDRLKADIDACCQASDAHLAPDLQHDLAAMLFEYEALKAKAGQVDFHDLLIHTRDLLLRHGTVRQDLQNRYTHLFIDEFQDTDPLQAEILMLLAADTADQTDWRSVRPVRGKLFIVGDPKQSIYRFRRADVGLYEAIKQQIVRAGGQVLDLQVSFRSVPELQDAVNAAFQTRMSDTAGFQARYTPLLAYRPAHHGDHPCVVALPIPRPYGDFTPEMVDAAMEKSYPPAVAAYIEWLLQESGWTITERDNPTVPAPLQARHICLLFKRFRKFTDDLTRPYVQALEARQIGHILVGGTSFHLREEVGAIRNALAAIEWPDDELSVYATLHGPLFGLADGHLLAYRERHGRLHPYQPAQLDAPPELLAVSTALSILRDLHRARNRRPVAVTISRLLAATRAHAGVAIWQSGEQALANVTRLMDIARQAEQEGLTSFRAFVSKLQEDEAHGEASEAPILEEGTEGVRLMTVHKAKGLEFPVVILCDPTANEAHASPSRWVDVGRRLCVQKLAGCAPIELLEHTADELEREREEAVRLLYVACTRARDLLVVPTLADKRLGGWTAAFEPAVYPSAELARTPVTSHPAGCPPFGEDAIAVRPVPRPADSVAPGLHRLEAGGTVVWWDPARLRLEVPMAMGLRQDKLLAADASGQHSQAGVLAHDTWQQRRVEVRERASQPSVRVATVTEHKGREGRTGGPVSAGQAETQSPVPLEADEIPVEKIPQAPGRPAGRRFGTLVHAILATIDLAADEAQIARHASLYARIVGSSEAEQQAARDTVRRALLHPLLQAASSSIDCRREMPVLLPLADGALVEGVVDLAFEDEGGWTVVDFKTDRQLEDRLGDYQQQVALYVQAIQEASGKPTRGVLLQV